MVGATLGGTAGVGWLGDVPDGSAAGPFRSDALARGRARPAKAVRIARQRTAMPRDFRRGLLGQSMYQERIRRGVGGGAMDWECRSHAAVFIGGGA